MNLLFKPNPLPNGSNYQARPAPTVAKVVALTNARKAVVDARVTSLTADLASACAAAMTEECRIGSGAEHSGRIALLTQQLTEAEAEQNFYAKALVGLGV